MHRCGMILWQLRCMYSLGMDPLDSLQHSPAAYHPFALDRSLENESKVRKSACVSAPC